jgi:hypothetical protein
VREVFVDYNTVGWAKRAHTLLFSFEQEGLEVGEIVLATGDSVDSRRARVVAIDGTDVELEFLDPLDRAG